MALFHVHPSSCKPPTHQQYLYQDQHCHSLLLLPCPPTDSIRPSSLITSKAAAPAACPIPPRPIAPPLYPSAPSYSPQCDKESPYAAIPPETQTSLSSYNLVQDQKQPAFEFALYISLWGRIMLSCCRVAHRVGWAGSMPEVWDGNMGAAVGKVATTFAGADLFGFGLAFMLN